MRRKRHISRPAVLITSIITSLVSGSDEFFFKNIHNILGGEIMEKFQQMPSSDGYASLSFANEGCSSASIGRLCLRHLRCFFGQLAFFVRLSACSAARCTVSCASPHG